MDNLSPLPSFARKRTARVQGPRPCSWITHTSTPDEKDVWPWTYHRAGLSRESTIYSKSSSESTHSHHSSETSFSSCAESTSSFDYDVQSKSRSNRSHRRRPCGPRPRHDVLDAGVCPSLSVKTPLSLEFKALPQHLETSRQPASPDITPHHPVPMHPPLSPTDFLLDWDAIFEVLNL